MKHLFPSCQACAHCARYVGICKRKENGTYYQARMCDEERKKYSFWETALLLRHFRCGPDARFFKPIEPVIES